jgi:hypothetical protein
MAARQPAEFDGDEIRKQAKGNGIRLLARDKYGKSFSEGGRAGENRATIRHLPK